MPQLVPFYFVNSIVIVILALSILLYVLSTFILPVFPRTQLARMYITIL